MHETIRRLRRKYIGTAFAIACGVMALMLLLLNLLMYASNRGEQAAALDLITQTALSQRESLASETFVLEEMEQNADGDYLIPRDIQRIAAVTLSGKLTCTDPEATWYSAGGGLMYQVEEDDQTRFAYREYQFQQNTAEVTVDFSEDGNVRYETDPVAFRTSGVTAENFLVSIVWWTSGDDVALQLDRVTVQYKTDEAFGDAPIRQNLGDCFPEGMPQALEHTPGLFLIANDTGTLLAVGDGGLAGELSDTEAGDYAAQILAKQNSDGCYTSPTGTSYRYQVRAGDGVQILALVSDANADGTKLLVISLLSGAVILLLILGILVGISGRVVRPAADAIAQQRQFISDASHELKTPITVIAATADMLERKHGSDPWIDCIRAQSTKLGDLVGEMLELARLSETAGADPQFVAVDLSEVVTNTLLYFDSRAFEEQHPIRSQIETGITLSGHREKLERLVGILVDNALRYADPSGEILVTLSRKKGQITLICQNPCRDFDAAGIQRMFQRFYRGDPSHGGTQKGYGLGLSIAQAIVARHGGEIEMRYDRGQVLVQVIWRGRQSGNLYVKE